MGDYDDPYGRIVFRDGTSIPAGRRPSHPGHGQTVPHSSGHRMQHSLSHPRIQSHQGWSKLHQLDSSTNISSDFSAKQQHVQSSVHFASRV